MVIVAAPGHGGSWEDVIGGVEVEKAVLLVDSDNGPVGVGLGEALASEETERTDRVGDEAAERDEAMEEDDIAALLGVSEIEVLPITDAVLVLKNEIVTKRLDGGGILPHDVEILNPEPLIDSTTKQV
jgi:hypothetical protein